MPTQEHFVHYQQMKEMFQNLGIPKRLLYPDLQETAGESHPYTSPSFHPTDPGQCARLNLAPVSRVWPQQFVDHPADHPVGGQDSRKHPPRAFVVESHAVPGATTVL